MEKTLILTLTISAFSIVSGAQEQLVTAKSKTDEITSNNAVRTCTSTSCQAADGSLEKEQKGGTTNTIKKVKAPKEIYDLFGSELNNAQKKTVSVDELSNKVIGVYFSAHWCPPCRAFTPRLVDFYNSMKKKGKPFEIVFVSSDRSRKDMYNYMTEMKMPWLALPYGDKHKKTLSKKYNVRGIPKLVIISPSGRLITDNGRGDVTKGDSKVFDKWQTPSKKTKSQNKTTLTVYYTTINTNRRCE